MTTVSSRSSTAALSRCDSLLSAITAALGRPTFRAEGVALYQGDAQELLHEIPPSLVDLTVTSPPYNIGKQYETKLVLGDYVSWCERWIRLIHAATAADGAFWLNVGYLQVPGKARALPIPYLLWNRVDFFLVQEIVWNYGAGVANRRSFSPRNEKFLWYVKKRTKLQVRLGRRSRPERQVPESEEKRQAEVQPSRQEPHRCVAVSQGDVRHEPEFQGAHAPPRSVSPCGR